MAGAAIHIHEDDCGLRLLHPAAAWPDVTSDVSAARRSGVENRAPDGVGWTAMHVIGEPRVTWKDMRLALTDVTPALERHFPRVRSFTATAMAGFEPGVRDPYGSYETDAWCFGNDASCFIKIDAEADRVARIWFECKTEDAKARASLRAAIEEIDRIAPALIADYWLDAAGLVSDAEFLTSYFAALGS